MRELTSPSPDDRVLGALLAASMFNPTADKVAGLLATIVESRDRRLFVLDAQGNPTGIVAIRRDGAASAEITHIAVRRMLMRLASMQDAASRCSRLERSILGSSGSCVGLKLPNSLSPGGSASVSTTPL